MAKQWGDEEGFFWDAPVRVGRSASGKDSGESVRADVPLRRPPAPSYERPQSFPDLRRAKRIVFDCETFDPKLKQLGPGTRRKDGYIVGFGIRTEDWSGEYYPVRHEYGKEHNLDPQQTFRWLNDQFRDFEGEIVGANIGYDVDWCSTEDVRFSRKAKFRDVQFAEPLLDEDADGYSLEDIASRQLGKHKEQDALFKLYGDNVKARMHEVHPGHMKPYVMGDINLPHEILNVQQQKLEREGLSKLFDLECRLIPLLQYMREIGVRVDIDAAQHFEDKLKENVRDTHKRLRDLVGFDVNVWAADSLVRAFKQQSIPYQVTAKGNPSFTSKWLENHPSDLATLIHAVRKYERFEGTFVKGYILDGNLNGRIHCLFHPLRAEHEFGSYGTVSGRFSSSHPNLQNIPTRDEVLGPLCRSLFIPEEGCQWWSYDYSQIEYRFLVHYAVAARCIGADVAQRMYRLDPKTDYHTMVAELTGLPRKLAKNINFGLAYGMGVWLLAQNIGRSIEEALPIFDTYHARVPFVKQLYNMASTRAQDAGFIRTIYNRKRRFDLYEPRGWWIQDEESEGRWVRTQKKPDRDADRPPAFTYEECCKFYGTADVKRAFTHKSLNAVLQGSAADLAKLALAQQWDEGLVGFGAPLHLHLTVHDEEDGSSDESKEARQARERVREIMVNALTLNVPVMVDGQLGKNWSEAH